MPATLTTSLENLPLRILAHDDFAHIQVTAESLDLPTTKQIFDHLAESSHPGIKRVLIEDCVGHWRLTTGGIVTLIDTLRNCNIFDLRIALLSKVESHLHELRFAETAAVNRGYEAKTFSDAVPAIQWLLKV